MDGILIDQVLLEAPELLDRFRRSVMVAHHELTSWNEHELHRHPFTKVQRERPHDRRVPRHFIRRLALSHILPKGNRHQDYLRSG